MRREEVYAQLARVYDPELDQPLTELGFIADVIVDDATVTVGFRLPTYWCAPNFAFMMAADIRARVSELPWVEDVDVRLRDHFFEREINDGVNAGRSFVATFPELATDNLTELRETFRVKAFLARQERLLRLLQKRGWADETILDLRVGDLSSARVRSDGPAESGAGRTAEDADTAPDGEATKVAEHYLAILNERGLDTNPAAPAIVHPDGRRIDPCELRAVLGHAQRTRLAVEFNAVVCRGLLETRYGG
jgi:metal-sulfur cluster biosynthetic enzyme